MPFCRAILATRWRVLAANCAARSETIADERASGVQIGEGASGGSPTQRWEGSRPRDPLFAEPTIGPIQR
jgi:hypothetical protein